MLVAPVPGLHRDIHPGVPMPLRRILPVLLATALASATSGCAVSDDANADVAVSEAGTGPTPMLPAPETSLIPVVKVAKAVGWQAGEAPTAAPGFIVTAFARNLDHPRWLYVLPNGDVLVAETNAPPKPEESSGGIRGWIMKLMMKRAGAAVPSADRITLLRDRDGDGQAEVQEVFVDGLHSPFGMALVGERFFVANADAIVEFAYTADATRLEGKPRRLAALPAGRNHHWTKSLIASEDGRTLYVGVGSNSNIGENGMDEEHQRAAILAVDTTTGASRVFASGLRNPVGLAWNPASGELWTSVNERDELGNDLVPDYMTSVRQGEFFGWPYSYFGPNVDTRVEPQRPELVAAARVPDYALGAHTSSLGLTFYTGTRFPERFRGGAFVGQHGSWNRKPPAGYRVVFVPFAGGRPSGDLEPVLTGFLDEEGQARGRPVGVAVASDGALLVADDVGNIVWRMTPALR
jgi:glucose/arabinose dehydrogenase